MLDYKIITKEEYKKIRMNSVSASFLCKGITKEIDENWDNLRGGYNFAIAVGKEDKPMLYSVEYFNKHILNGQDKSKDLTVKLNLDTTEFEERLNRVGKQLERIKSLADTLKFSNEQGKKRF